MADDVEPSVELAPVELAPVVPRSAVRRGGRWRRGAAAVAIAAVATSVALLIANLLGDAALFFYNADEAVERRDELGSRRFKIQGTPLAEPETAFKGDLPVLVFSIGFNGVVVDVVHAGDPPDLFQPGVPVVLEGAWERRSDAASLGLDAGYEAEGGALPDRASSWHFVSDRMVVKHDNDYRDRDDYQERVVEADSGGESR